jgi:hypothetical protein
MDTKELSKLSWDECRLHVLSELIKMNDLLVRLDDKIDSLGFKVAGIAAVVGILVTLITNIIILKVNGG